MSAPARQPIKVFVSHSHEDNDACKPLLETLEAFGVDYWFDTKRLRAGQGLTREIQAAINDRDIFIRVCSAAVQRNSFWVDLETEAFRASQAKAVKEGRPKQRVLIPFILDEGYSVQLFDASVLYIDAARKPTDVWTQDLRDALGIDAQTTQSAAVEKANPQTRTSPVVVVRAWLWTYCAIAPLALYLSLLGIFGRLVVPRAAETGGWLQTYVVTMGPLLGLAPLAVALVFSLRARQNGWLLFMLVWGFLLSMLTAVSNSAIVGQVMTDSLRYGSDFGPTELRAIPLLLLPMFVAPILYSFWGMGATRHTPDTLVCLVASWLISVALLTVVLSVAVVNAVGAAASTAPYTAPFATGIEAIGGIPLILALALTLVDQRYRSFLALAVVSLCLIFAPPLFGQGDATAAMMGSFVSLLAPSLVALVYFTSRIVQRQRTAPVVR